MLGPARECCPTELGNFCTALAIWQAVLPKDRRIMNAYSSEFHQLRSEAESGHMADQAAVGAAVVSTAAGSEEADAIAQRWNALHAAAAAVAGLAQLGLEQEARQTPDFAGFISGAPCWKVSLLRNGLDDIAAFMQSGLTALLAVNAAGRSPAAAASALWAEFLQSRNALLESILRQ